MLYLKIKDDEGAENTYAIPLDFKRPEVELLQSVAVNKLSEINQAMLKASIQSISAQGEVLIKFSAPIETCRLNLTFLNSSTLSIYLETYGNWHADVQGYNNSNLNFTWNATNLTSTELVLQLYFNNPLAISPKAKQDFLVWHLLDLKANENLFYSKELGVALHQNFTTLRSPIKKQMIPSRVA